MARKLTAMADALRKGIAPSAEDIEGLERLTKLKTLFAPRDNGHEKSWKFYFFPQLPCCSSGLTFVRVSSTAVDLDVARLK